MPEVWLPLLVDTLGSVQRPNSKLTEVGRLKSLARDQMGDAELSTSPNQMLLIYRVQSNVPVLATTQFCTLATLHSVSSVSDSK